MKFSVMSDRGHKRPFIMGTNIETEEYDHTLKKSKEFLAAEKGLGPYVEFGLSKIHGILSIAIG